MLDISKIENGKMTLASEPFRLSAVLSHVASAVRVQCEQRARIRRDNSAMRRCRVRGRCAAHQATVAELVDECREVHALRRLRSVRDHGGEGAAMGYRQVKFTVSDNGIGMSEEFKEHIFEPFSMEGRSREQGTGLGMPIVKNIVTMMAGDIAVESTKGRALRSR